MKTLKWFLGLFKKKPRFNSAQEAIAALNEAVMCGDDDKIKFLRVATNQRYDEFELDTDGEWRWISGSTETNNSKSAYDQYQQNIRDNAQVFEYFGIKFFVMLANGGYNYAWFMEDDGAIAPCFDIPEAVLLRWRQKQSKSGVTFIAQPYWD